MNSLTGLLAALAALGLSATLASIHSYRRNKRESAVVAPFRLSPSLESGLWGGLIGGLVAGSVVAASYYVTIAGSSWVVRRFFHGSRLELLGDVVLPIAIGVAVSGAVMGAAIQLGAQLASRAWAGRTSFAELLGGLPAGILGGAFVGAFMGRYFGAMLAPPVSRFQALASAVVVWLGIVTGSLAYDYRGRRRYLLRAVVLASIITLATTLPLSAMFPQNLINDFFASGGSLWRLWLGGMLCGAAVGGVLGGQAGLTFFLFRSWTRWEVPSRAPDPSAAYANLRRIQIFLASSSELLSDRDDLELYLRQQNDRLIMRGMVLEVRRWETSADAVEETSKQQCYNEMAKQCEIFVGLFFTKAGEYTRAEFESAYAHFLEHKRPSIYTYFRDAIRVEDAQQEDLQSLRTFRDRLHSLGHYPTKYGDAEHLKRHFRDQLENHLSPAEA